MNSPDKKVLLAIGSSAGGIESLSTFVAHLPDYVEACIVIAQHLSPKALSELDIILMRHCNKTIRSIDNKAEITQNTIWVTPPGFDVVVDKHHLKLVTPTEDRTMPSINLLFRTLAEQDIFEGIGCIFSGTGTDGVQGLLALKKRGFTTIAQQPNTARYNGMPLAAIKNKCVDLIVSPNALALKVNAIINSDSITALTGIGLTSITDIIDEVRNQTGIDLSNYKTGTLERRIQRRIHAYNLENLYEYLELLKQKPAELKLLAKEAFISLTDFFRDPKEFHSIKTILTDKLSKQPPHLPFRAWIAGCATGQEAYSLAFMIDNIITQHKFKVKYQIYATDIDEGSLCQAKLGVYSPINIQNIAPSLRDQYFTSIDDNYQVVKHIKNKIRFSTHNLVQDAYFSGLDLISCRNVLIYFNRKLQKQIHARFHNALNCTGILFLGSSERIYNSEYFNKISGLRHIYQKNNEHISDTEDRPEPNKSVENPLSTLPFAPTQLAEESTNTFTKSMATQAYQLCFDQLHNGLIVIDGKLNVVYFSNIAKEYISFATPNKPLHTQNLAIHTLIENFELLIKQVIHDGKTYGFSRHYRNARSLDLTLHIQLFPIMLRSNSYALIVIREAVPEAGTQQPDTDNAIVAPGELKQQLGQAQQTITSQAQEITELVYQLAQAQKNAQVANDQYHNANEELQTINEELQSTNEELLIINDEVLEKNLILEKQGIEYNALYNYSGLLYILINMRKEVVAFHKQVTALQGFESIETGKKLDDLKLSPEVAQHITDHTNDKNLYPLKIASKDQIYQINCHTTFNDLRMPIGYIVCLQDITQIEAQFNQVTILNNIISSFADALITVDKDFKVLFCTQSLDTLCGIDNDSIIGKKITFFSEPSPELLEKHNFATPDMLNEEAYRHESHLRLTVASSNFGIVPIDVKIDRVSNQDSNIAYVLTLRDLTEIINFEQRLYALEMSTVQMLDSIPDGVIRVNSDWRIIYANQQARKWFSRHPYQGMKIEQVLAIYNNTEQYKFSSQTISTGENYTGTISINHQKRIFNFYASMVKSNNTTTANDHTLVFRDITEHESMMEKIKWDSTHDALTQLPNRNYLVAQIHALLKSPQTEVSIFLYLDLDQFKVVNDSLGHKAGDELLRQLVSQLKAPLRNRDILARLGGDEFGILLAHCPQSRAIHIARSMISQLSNFRFAYQSKIFRIGASIGIREFTNNEHDVDKIINDADHACYIAKRQGRNRYYVFDDCTQAQHDLEMIQLSTIQEALDKDLFELYFQEIRPLKHLSQRQSYWEVLVRMKVNDEVILPGAFFASAERYNLVHQLDCLICDKISDIMRQHYPPDYTGTLPTLSINLSAQTLSNPQMIGKIYDLLNKSHLPLDHYCLEVTETAAITNYAAVKDFLVAMRDKGCKIAIDDFGTGMASFSYLKSLPVDIIKIDGSIVKNIEQEVLDFTLVQSIHEISQVLDCVCVAEYVESEATAHCLERIGIDYIQGYYVGKAKPLTEWIQQIA